MTDTPQEELEKVAQTLSHSVGFNETLVHLTYRALESYFVGETCLEIGSGEGLQIPFLLKRFKQLTVVEGAETLVERVRRQSPTERLQVVHCMAQEYQPADRFDTIVMGHVLAHLEDGVSVIRKAREWTGPGGRLLICESNADSIHRSAAVLMGLLSSPTELSPLKRSLGQRRVYTRALLESEAQAAGWIIERFGGFFLKPLSNDQLQSICTPELVEAYYELGRRYPDIAAEIFVVCRLPDH